MRHTHSDGREDRPSLWVSTQVYFLRSGRSRVMANIDILTRSSQISARASPEGRIRLPGVRRYSAHSLFASSEKIGVHEHTSPSNIVAHFVRGLAFRLYLHPIWVLSVSALLKPTPPPGIVVEHILLIGLRN